MQLGVREGIEPPKCVVFKTIARTNEQALTITARRRPDCGRFKTSLSLDEAKASGFCFIRIGEPESHPLQ